MDSRKRKLTVAAKHTCYILLMLLGYVLQTTPGLFTLWGIKPIWVVPLAVVISAYEGEYIGALYGMLAGLFGELAAGRIIGSFSVMMILLCFLTGVSIALYLRRTVLNLSLLSGFCLLLIGSADFVFSYWLQGYGAVSGVYFRQVLPTVIYSGACTFINVWLVKRIHAKFVYEDA